mmetsp:Transcript_8620/g.28418  ORF Transcript_8620/g.28418 Transcript_8620/m.28418 type:complete len:441 (+) Transcript_8620:123-1445(+)
MNHARTATPMAAVPDVREPRVMEVGDVVLIEVNEGDRASFVTIKAEGEVEIGKRQRVPVKALLGAPFGSTYEVIHGTGAVVRIGPECVDHEDVGSAPTEDERSNKNVSNKQEGAQQLSDGEISALRKKFTAEEVVEIITRYSKTFEDKTAFAQEKYRARKLKKHMTKFLARFPSPRHVCEQYFYNNANKTSYMRHDALSMLVNLGNIGAHAQPIVVDTCAGLVLGAVTNRMGGFGRLCNAFVGQSPMGMEAMLMMNLDENHLETVRHAAISDLVANRKKFQNASSVDEKANETERSTVEESEKKDRKFMKIKYADDEHMDEFAREGFTSLIVASLSVEPKATLEQLLPLCAPSAPFAVWFNAAQPLAEALHHLRNENIAINLTLHEPFLREQQVLPGRTHPVMTTDAGSGGYVLSGIYVPRSVSSVESDGGEHKDKKQKA